MEQGLLVSCLETKTLIEALETTAKIGYRNCEISVCPDDSRPNLATLDDKARKRAADRARELGMKISSVQCHAHNGYADASPAVRSAAVDHTRKMIDLCGRLGIPVCTTVSGVAEDNAPWEKKLDRVADSCRKILDHAKGGPVAVGFEPVFVYVVGNLAHTKALLDGLDQREDFKINYDPSHFPYHDEPAEDFIRALGKRIVHAHSKDAIVRPVTEKEKPDGKDRFAMPRNRYFSFAPPGKGVLNWVSILAALRKAGFDGVLSLEMGHGYEGRPSDVAKTVYAFFAEKHGLK
ncbi:MAG: sugar phosphate isomerase/epimerase family protein [Planctomycetota bacterium]